MAKEIAPGVTMDSFNKEAIKSMTLEQLLKDHEAHDTLDEKVLRKVHAELNAPAGNRGRKKNQS